MTSKVSMKVSPHFVDITKQDLMRAEQVALVKVLHNEEYEEHITNFDGTTEEFYMYCLKTFDRSGKSIEKRGRPPKQR